MNYIKPIKVHGVYCNENANYSILQWLGVENYQLSFAYSWGFFYEEKDDCIGENLLEINPVYYRQREMLLEKYCGLGKSTKKLRSYSDLIQFTTSSVEENKPIGLFCDTYDIPWLNTHNTVHSLHHLIIVDLDEEGICKCFDPTFGVDVKELSLSNLGNYPLLLEEYSIGETLDISRTDLEVLLKESIDFLVEENISFRIETFKNSFMEHFRFDKEIKNLEIGFVNSPLMTSLHMIEGGRKLYCEFLEFIGFKLETDIFTQLVKEFEALIGKWESIKNILRKSYLTQYTIESHMRIIEILKKIIYEEAKMIDRLKTLGCSMLVD